MVAETFLKQVVQQQGPFAVVFKQVQKLALGL